MRKQNNILIVGAETHKIMDKLFQKIVMQSGIPASYHGRCPKVHFTPVYTYPNDGSIRAISVCGLHASSSDPRFIDCTIVEERVNCKNCLRIMEANKNKESC